VNKKYASFFYYLCINSLGIGLFILGRLFMFDSYNTEISIIGLLIYIDATPFSLFRGKFLDKINIEIL